MKAILLVGTLVATVVALGAASVATAGGGSEPLTRSGQCSRGTGWELKAKREDAGLEVELEVDQNRNGRRWRVTLTRNGRAFFRGIRVTRGPSGSFSVERRTGAAARNRIVATARALATGETCRATLTV